MRKVQWGQIYLKVVSEFEYRSNFLGLDSNLDNLTNQSFEIPSKSDISNIFCEIVIGLQKISLKTYLYCNCIVHTGGTFIYSLIGKT